MGARSATLAVGQVGVGFGQAVHVPAFRLDARARVEAVCASDPAKAQMVAERLGIARAHRTWQELVADPAIDVVSIAVPPALQVEIASAAAAHGKHLFLEKPVGVAVEPVRALASTVAERGLRASVDFLFTRVPSFEAARAAISGGDLGKVLTVAVEWRTRTYARRMGLDSWKLRAAPGGGALQQFASHTLHYVEWLAGPIERMTVTLFPDGERDERLEAQCDLAAGATATIAIDTNADGPPLHRVEVRGVRGSVVLENRGTDPVSGFDAASERTGDGRIPPVARLVAELLDAIERGTPTAVDLRDGLRVQALIEAARSSQRLGAPVAV